jgi:hypothetical protein
MMKYVANSAMAICLGIAMVWLVGCAPTTHVTETTSTREYDTTTPPVMAPVAASNTTTTTQYDNGSVQRTYTQPAPYAPLNQSTTTVTTDPTDGAVQKQTTTTYTMPYSTP